MDLKKRYTRLHEGIRFTIETIKDAYPLFKHLDDELQTWVLAEWESRRNDIDWCDNRRDLLQVTTGLTGLAESYRSLRKELFSDLHHFREESPWRKVHRGLAIRLPMHLHRKAPEHYVLRQRTGTGWTFVVHGRTDKDEEGEATLREFDVELSERSCRIPDELDGDPLLTQLFYGLRLMTGEHYYMRTLRQEVTHEAESILRAEEDDGDHRP